MYKNILIKLFWVILPSITGFGADLKLEARASQPVVSVQIAQNQKIEKIAELSQEEASKIHIIALAKLADELNQVGLSLFKKGDHKSALTKFEHSLEICVAIKNLSCQVSRMNNIGTLYVQLGDYDNALQKFQKSLQIAHNLNAQYSIGVSLTNIGRVYSLRGDYGQTLKCFEEALKIARNLNEKSIVSTSLNNLGTFHVNMGEYRKALDYFQEALQISNSIDDKLGTASKLGNIGNTYRLLGDYKQALKYTKKAWDILSSSGLKSELLVIGNNLGVIYERLGDHESASRYYQSGLVISRELQEKPRIIQSLNNIGAFYSRQKDYNQALQSYQEALHISFDLSDNSSINAILDNIGVMFEWQNQPKLAIAFYKKSVNTYEKIRTTNKKLSSEQQASYTQTIRKTYENLAALLFQQGRIAEALQVLDLLKVQDLQDFLKDLKGNDLTTQGICPLPQEVQNLQDSPKDLKGNDLTTQGICLLPQEIAILQNFEQQKPRSLDQWLTQPNLQTLIQQIKTTAPAAGLDSPGYKVLQTRLTQLSPNSALFYPLILPDRLELVILTPGKPPIHQTVRNLPKAELEQAIDTFSRQIGEADPYGNPTSTIEDTKKTAKWLYDRLIGPISADLKAANITTLLYAPDGKLRYIPLAALHDGQNWLIQTYTINHLTALALTPTTPVNTSQPKALVGAVTQGSNVQVAGQSYEYAPLDNTKVEATAIGTLFGTQPLIDQDLTRQSLQANLPSINIFHLASHAEFNPQSPELSFILLGNNQTLTLRDLKDLKLPNINLFVLSACETAKGVNKDGIELFGFGYQLQRNQVRAAIASLWKVNDGSTSKLMQSFYKNLNTRKIPPVEALQRAQRETLGDPTWNTLPNGQQLRVRGGSMGDDPNAPILPGIRRGDPTHPYYWAPFILIGNGL